VEAVAPTTIPRGTAAPGDVMRRLVLVAGAAAGDAVVLEGRIGS
jgi:hypothetical protein